jgi:integrase
MMNNPSEIVVAEVAPAGELSMPLPPALVPVVEAAGGYIEASLAANTRRAYENDWLAFERWCVEHELRALPAQPEVVALYISALASGQVAPRRKGRTKAAHRPKSIGRYLAAIRHVHAVAGHPSPCDAKEVRKVLKGVRRTHGTRPEKKRAATLDVVRVLVDALPSTEIGVRDRAIVLLGFWGAFRRSELAALTTAEITDHAEGLVVTVLRSKSDQDGAGQQVRIPRHEETAICPVAALAAWRAALAARGVTDGALFRSLSRRNLLDALDAAYVAKIVKAAAKAAGLDPRPFAAHSLRSGFITSAARAGKGFDVIREKSRHKSYDVLAGYIHPETGWANDAGRGMR